MRKLTLLLVGLACLLVVQAGATVVIGVPGSNLNMPPVNYFGGGPIIYGNYTWSSTNNGVSCCQGGSVYGYTGGYGYINNGIWDGALGPMAGLNDSFDVYGVTDTMTFAFATPVMWTGGFFNYVPGGTTPTTLAVWDAGNNLIESYNLTFNFNNPNGVNLGWWIQFQETTPISYFTMTGNYVGVANPIPEPGTLALLGTGVLGLAGILRRKLMP